MFITTYGCQMNVNDTERMFSLLEMANYSPVSTPEEASLIIINSCSVREKPVHKVRSEVGRYRKLKQNNPGLKIGVGGCVAQQEKKKLLKDIPLLDFVFGTDAIDKLPQIISDVEADEGKVVSAKFEHQKPYQIETLVRNPGVSTFVNITKGCDNFCTFCVVPFTRGRERSRTMSELITDINSLTKRGVKEVTLVGQNVNSYLSSCGSDFPKLLKTVAKDTDIERIRYTTCHPKDFNEDLVEVLAEHTDKIPEYIHLPVQSGNSAVLERMNRGYTREQYFQKINMIKNILPHAVFSTDIIVGFPGETEEQFMDTYTMLEQVKYESIYAFTYSPRPFTKAAKFTDQVPEHEKSERLQRLFAVQKEIAMPLAKTYMDKVLQVLVEEHNEETGVSTGRSTQNKVVHFAGEKNFIGKTFPVKINKTNPMTLYGDLQND